MKRIGIAALLVLLSSCQTVPSAPQEKDYAALAAAAVAKYTIANNDVYGFTPEGRFERNLPILETRKEGPWTVYTVPEKKHGFDRAEVTVDESGTIVRLRFFKATHSAFGRQDEFNTIYQELKSKYKAVQTLGDTDTAELTVNVANNVEDWKQHYIEYLQLMDEPNNLGAQFSWILQPHLSEIRAVFQRQGSGANLVVDYQTKMYATAMKNSPTATN